MDTVNSLNGSVHSQGVKVDHRAWLDMGSADWQSTPDKVKAAAYQAAKVCGWTDVGLKVIITNQFGPRVDEFMAQITIDTLKELAEQYPIPVEQVYESKPERPKFKVAGSDATFQLPETK